MQTKRHLLVAIVVDMDVDSLIEVGAEFRWPASSGVALVWASASAERPCILEFLVFVVFGFLLLFLFQSAADLGGRWCMTCGGGAKCTRKFWNTVEVNIMKIGRVCLRSLSLYYSFITMGS